MLDWKTFVYSFTATEDTYAITGSFEQGLNLAPSDWGRWDDHNQLHGVLNTYYPNNEDSWYMDIKGDYDYISVIAKNTKEPANSYEGIAGGGYRIVLRATLDNGKVYAFSIWVNADKIYAYNHFGAGGSVTGWSGAWKNVAEVNAEAAAALNGDGAEFKLDRITGNKLRITINGSILETYTMEGVTDANKVVSMGVAHYGNTGVKVAMPYTIGTDDSVFYTENGKTGYWDMTNQHDGSVTLLNHTKDGDAGWLATRGMSYSEVAVNVKDFTPSKNADGSLKKGNFSMQFSFMFADGKEYAVRLHNTDNDGNYKLQNMGTNLTGWKWQADLTADQKAKLLDGDGVEFRVKLTASGAELYVDGQLLKTFDLGDYNGQLAQIRICMNGNNNVQSIKIPFEVK
jgi:hypothetical protein